jgi:chorismate dehydratase
LCSLPIGKNAADVSADAVLLIGDRAIHSPTEAGFVEAWDLGDEWCRWAELPFVFAMWVARDGVAWRGLDDTLAAVRDAGVAHLEEIAAQEAAAVRLSTRQTLTYLRDHLHFYLGSQEQRGLELYYRYAQRLETGGTGGAADHSRRAVRTLTGVADE